MENKLIDFFGKALIDKVYNSTYYSLHRKKYGFISELYYNNNKDEIDFYRQMSLDGIDCIQNMMNSIHRNSLINFLEFIKQSDEYTIQSHCENDVVDLKDLILKEDSQAIVDKWINKYGKHLETKSE